MRRRGGTTSERGSARGRRTRTPQLEEAAAMMSITSAVRVRGWIMNLPVVIVITATAVLANAAASPPQKPEDSWPDMPTYDIFTKAELNRDFVTMRFAKPLDKPELGFSVMAPTTWDEVPLTISKEEAANDDQGMVSLALLAGKDKRLRIE